ncbi:hypothetical protein CEXT_335171 [Caerostris extrusa]|uniref:Uncharacterized protein n=1 Tax=Caerostris extrusa TaxID=172846 RepID=A0AAV4NLN9_CAEEX|nr:hypothetical protein CEXT_335171 [Caerostris extrusa]
MQTGRRYPGDDSPGMQDGAEHEEVVAVPEKFLFPHRVRNAANFYTSSQQLPPLKKRKNFVDIDLSLTFLQPQQWNRNR